MLTKAEKGIEKAIKHLEVEYSKLQLGRANPSIIEDIMVESYGVMQAIKNTASISTLDSQTLSIKPWDRTIINKIAKAISDEGIGLNPQTMADSIIIKIPALTEERRKELAKVAKKYAEEAKIGVRNARAESNKDIKQAEDKKEISEDQAKDYSSDLQKMVEKGNEKIEELAKKKETDIMKI